MSLTGAGTALQYTKKTPLPIRAQKWSMSTMCVTTMFFLARDSPTVRRCLSPGEARPAESLAAFFVSQWDNAPLPRPRPDICFDISADKALLLFRFDSRVPTNATHPCCFARLAIKIIDERGGAGANLQSVALGRRFLALGRGLFVCLRPPQGLGVNWEKRNKNRTCGDGRRDGGYCQTSNDCSSDKR